MTPAEHDAVVELAADRRTGTDRQMLAYALWRVKNKQALHSSSSSSMIPTSVATRSTPFGAPMATTKHVDASSRYATIPTTGYVRQFKMR